MVSTRMEKVDNLEKEFLTFKESMEQNMKTIMSFMETQAEKQGKEGRPTVLEGETSREQPIEMEEREEGCRTGWGEREEARWNSRLRKLELPIFDGHDPVGWIIKIERFLVLGGFPKEEWLSAAVMALEDKALSWFTWAEARRPFRSWQVLKQEILDRFQGKQDSLGCEVLLALRQEGTVEEFREQFEAVASVYRGVSEEVLIGAFMNGLKEEIAVEVRMFRPQGLGNIMSLAQSVERRNEALRKVTHSSRGGTTVGWSSSSPRFSFSRASSAYEGFSSSQAREKTNVRMQTEGMEGGSMKGSTTSNNQRNSTVGSGPKAGMVRRLSEEEHRRCREQGLCFKCFERYSPTHVCKNKQLHILIVSEEMSEENVNEEVQEQ